MLKTIFRCSICLKHTNRMCWTIQLIQKILTEPDVNLFMNLTKFGSSHEKFDVWHKGMSAAASPEASCSITHFHEP